MSPNARVGSSLGYMRHGRDSVDGDVRQLLADDPVTWKDLESTRLEAMQQDGFERVPNGLEAAQPIPLSSPGSPMHMHSAASTSRDSAEAMVGLALYTSSTITNSGMSLFAKLLGSPHHRDARLIAPCGSGLKRPSGLSAS